MINKIVEESIDGTEVVLLDVSGVTAVPSAVVEGAKFVTNFGQLVSGVLRVAGGGFIVNPHQPLAVEYSRYRIVPTKDEYEKFSNGEFVYDYDLILPAMTVGDTGDFLIRAGNELCLFTVTDENIQKFVVPVYDNKHSGWVVGTLQPYELTDEEKLSLGISLNEYAIYRQVLTEILNKYSKFVMPSKFGIAQTYVTGGKVLYKYNYETSNGVAPYLEGDQLTWKNLYNSNSLMYRLYALLGRQIKLMLPTLRYELSKFLIKNKIFDENNTTTDITNLMSALAQLRAGNHIDTSTMMTSANTPEVIEGQTQLETLEKYMSSIFKTETHTEDDYTRAYSHFDDLFSELVTKVTYSCLIPN